MQVYAKCAIDRQYKKKEWKQLGRCRSSEASFAFGLTNSGDSAGWIEHGTSMVLYQKRQGSLGKDGISVLVFPSGAILEMRVRFD